MKPKYWLGTILALFFWLSAISSFLAGVNEYPDFAIVMPVLMYAWHQDFWSRKKLATGIYILSVFLLVLASYGELGVMVDMLLHAAFVMVPLLFAKWALNPDRRQRSPIGRRAAIAQQSTDAPADVSALDRAGIWLVWIVGIAGYAMARYYFMGPGAAQFFIPALAVSFLWHGVNQKGMEKFSSLLVGGLAAFAVTGMLPGAIVPIAAGAAPFALNARMLRKHGLRQRFPIVVQWPIAQR